MGLFGKNSFLYLTRGCVAMNAAVLKSVGSRETRSRMKHLLPELGVYQRTPRLDKAPTTEYVPLESSVTLTHIGAQDWQVSTLELAFITSLAAKMQPRSIFEYGTFDGRTTLNLASNCPQAAIHTLDLPPGTMELPEGKQAGMLIEDLIAQGRVRQLYGDSQAFDFSPYAGQQQLVFIDANHDYPFVKADTASALRLLEGNEGVIVWHDYARWPGVTRAVDEYAAVLTSDVRFRWIEGTSLAVMTTEPGVPLKLS